MPITLFLSGDVMTGRGVDQILPHPSRPGLYEPIVRSALEYVTLAEQANGRMPRAVDFTYVWGAALEALEDARPDARIVNLETSVTTSEDAEPKGINYRMHPGNVPVLTAARIDCCVLANNHVLDWGRAGLAETLDVLSRAGIRTAGAGRDLATAQAPAVLDAQSGGGRILIFGFGAQDAGVPATWAARESAPGVHRLPDFSPATADRIGELVEGAKRPGDLAVASLHWGPNWGYDIPSAHRRFAHALIERGHIDVVHGHSSHHPMAIEVHRGRPIFYGVGDLLNDYEGIRGYESFRTELSLMYLPSFDAGTGALVRLRMTPMRIRNFRLNRAARADRVWLRDVLDRECHRFDHQVVLRDDSLELVWT